MGHGARATAHLPLLPGPREGGARRRRPLGAPRTCPGNRSAFLLPAVRVAVGGGGLHAAGAGDPACVLGRTEIPKF